jgi:hypothetical protein
MEVRTTHRLRFGLLALAFIVFGGKSYEVLLRGIDSNIHAAVAMSVTSPDAAAESQSQVEKSKTGAPLVSPFGIGLSTSHSDEKLFLPCSPTVSGWRPRILTQTRHSMTTHFSISG